MNNRSKSILILLSFIIVLLSGFVFGRYIIPGMKQGNNTSPDNVVRVVNSKDIADSRQNAITETVKNVSSAVVGINVTEMREYKDPFGDMFGNDPFFKQFFGDRSYKQEVHGLGSGFIVSDDGYIITNDHVVNNATKVVVSLTDGEHVDATIVGVDYANDIALLKIDKSGLPFLRFGNSDDIIIGEWVIAFGNPFGLFEVNQKPTVTVGVISSTGMKLSSGENRFYRNMIQTDAAINSGNSGGPLVNSVGEVIGMNTLIYTGNQFSSGNIGLGFAIPINKVKKITDEIKSKGTIDRNYWIGLRIQNIDNNIAQYYKLKSTTGVIVVSVEKGSPADYAGIIPEDIIIGVNNQPISNDADFWGMIFEANPGDKLDIKLLHGGDEKTKELEIKKK
ncbi:MAG: S1C family serine protease [Ignavibacteria bacterium]